MKRLEIDEVKKQVRAHCKHVEGNRKERRKIERETMRRLKKKGYSE